VEITKHPLKTGCLGFQVALDKTAEFLYFDENVYHLISSGKIAQMLVTIKILATRGFPRVLSIPKYPDPSKLAILRTQTLLDRFKPFHWRVQ